MDWKKAKPKGYFPYVFGSKNYIEDRNKFFKENGGPGFEYHEWWIFQGSERIAEKNYFIYEEKKTKQKTISKKARQSSL